jgi:hypothetical protein
MFSLRMVPMLCCLLLPLQALAQAQPPEEVILGPVSPPPLLPAPGAPAQEEPKPAEPTDAPEGEIIPPAENATRGSGATTASRVSMGIILGVVGGALAATPGTIMAGEALCLESCSGDGDGVWAGLGLALGGLFLGTAFTITQVGYWMDGQGSFWPTLAGVVVGSLTGLLVGVAVAASAGAPGAIPMILGPSVGGVIAYELSDTRNRSAAAEGAGPEPRIILPMMTVSPRGGIIGGFVGTF